MTRAILTVWLVLTAVRPAVAQDPPFDYAQGEPGLRAHRFTVTAGVGLLGSYGIGDATAALRRNETGTSSPGSVTLFSAKAAVERASSVEARVGFTLTPTVAVEFGGSYSRPVVAVDIVNDNEAGETPRLTDQQLSQYVVDVSGVWQITKLQLGRRARPYVTFGGGYLRQLDVDRVRAETGKIFHAGAGLRYWLWRSFAARAEFDAEFRSGGVTFERGTRVAPAVKLFAFYAF